MTSKRRAPIVVCGALLFAACVLSSHTPAHANTYAMPNDYRIVCLDFKTGKKLWQWAPGPLFPPQMHVAGDVLVVEDQRAASNLMDPMQPPRRPGTQRYLLELATGRPVQARPGMRTAALQAKALEPMGVLTDARGRTFEFKEGDTHALISRPPTGPAVTVLKLEDYVNDLNLVGNLAIFNFGVGDAYAYDLEKGRLAWEFDASRKLPDLSDEVYTGTAADAQGVYVSVDETLFALKPGTGELLWTTPLPKQGLRRFDNPWTTVARVGDRLMVLVYEKLFQIDPADGRILWTFGAGEHTKPWPVFYQDRLYVASREEPRRAAVPAKEKPAPAEKERANQAPVDPELALFQKQYRASLDLSHGHRKRSALKVQKKGAGLTLEVLSRREIPPGEPVFWSLSPPPPASQPAGHILLKIRDARPTFAHTSLPLTLDLTGLLAQRPAAYVKFAGPYNSAELIVDGKVVDTQQW